MRLILVLLVLLGSSTGTAAWAASDTKILQKELQAQEHTLEDTRARLIEVAAQVRKGEVALSDLESQIADLESRQMGLKSILGSDRRATAQLLRALQRLRRTPPQTLIFSPQTPLRAAQSALVMGRVVPSLRNRAMGLQTQLNTAQRIAADLGRSRRLAHKAMQDLRTEQETLETLLMQKQKIYAQTHQDLEERQSEAQRMAQQSRNLQDLIGKIKEAPTPMLASAGSAPLRALSRDLLMPAAGDIVVNYNQSDEFGAPSKGLRIGTTVGGLVVAPLSGVVRFAGPFKNYGQMVILEHEGGYHSLIAGLEKIDTVVGQNLRSGEPLGRASSKGTAKPLVYFELRHNGQPVDPARALRR